MIKKGEVFMWHEEPLDFSDFIGVIPSAGVHTYKSPEALELKERAEQKANLALEVLVAGNALEPDFIRNSLVNMYLKGYFDYMDNKKG